MDGLRGLSQFLPDRSFPGIEHLNLSLSAFLASSKIVHTQSCRAHGQSGFETVSPE